MSEQHDNPYAQVIRAILQAHCDSVRDSIENPEEMNAFLEALVKAILKGGEAPMQWPPGQLSTVALMQPFISSLVEAHEGVKLIAQKARESPVFESVLVSSCFIIGFATAMELSHTADMKKWGPAP